MRRGVELARRGLFLVGVAVAALYLVALVLLTVFQRDLLFIGNPKVADPPLAGSIYRAQRIVEPDGVRLTIWRAAPVHPGDPTIVFFYGNAGSLEAFSATGEQLHRQGYGAVLASYRGYGDNSGTPSEAGLMADARAILAAIPSRDGPIVLWGQSLGTGVAARMAAEGRGSALILQSPYTSVADVAARRFPIFPVRWLMRDRFDTLSLVSKIKMPVLILHGRTDETVPFDMGETLARRFGSDARFIPLMGGHDLYLGALVPIVADWLRDNPGVRQRR